VPAILEGFYLGQETGTAAADVLFGDVNPAGKLAVSFRAQSDNCPSFTTRNLRETRLSLSRAKTRSSFRLRVELYDFSL
jgi:hypothetical protein